MRIEDVAVDVEKSRRFVPEGILITRDGKVLVKKGADVLRGYEIKGKFGLKEVKEIDEETFRELQETLIAEEEEEPEEEVQIDDTVITQILRDIVLQALSEQASDVHVLPKKGRYEVRFRIDGLLRKKRELRKREGQMLVNKIKNLARLDISNSLVPQDGKFSLEGSEIRVSTCPTVFGEKAVMRIQRTSSVFSMTLEDVGFEEEDLALYREQFLKPWGMILNVGATGSGKTTTFYLTIKEIVERFGETRSVITIEDPVEIKFEKIDQVEVLEEAGRTFANVLRSALRQDPDVILIGEIRDEETAQMGVRASLTGHLVLATLHAVDSVNAISRLKDLGVSPLLLASTVNCILSQRLVRVLCECKKKREVSEEERRRYGLSFDYVWEPSGCEKCNYTGYRGRTAVVEILVFDEEIKELVSRGASEVEIRRKLLKEKGFRSLWKNALRKVQRGITSLEEVLTVISPDPEPREDPSIEVREILYPQKKVKVKVGKWEGWIFDRSRKGLSVIFDVPVPIEYLREVPIEVEQEGIKGTFVPRSYGVFEGKVVIGGLLRR